MKTTIEFLDPRNEGTFVEKRGRWCNYYENNELFASNLSLSNATHLYFQRQRERKEEKKRRKKQSN